MEKEIRIRHLLKLAEGKRSTINGLRIDIDQKQDEIDAALEKLNAYKAELYELGWSEENYAGDRRFPSLWKVCFAISLEAGGLNRDRSEKQIRVEFDKWLKDKAYAEASLKRYDTWCAQLTDEEVDIVGGSGEESEMDAILNEKKCPIALTDLFEDYFDEAG